MLHALTTSQIRGAEDYAVASGVCTMRSLMERAGQALADVVMQRYPDGGVAVVAGGGNNGGDGWVAARLLADAGRDVKLLTLAGPPITPLLKHVAGEAAAAGVTQRGVVSAQELSAALGGCAVIVDAVVGIGLTGAVREPVAAMLAAIDAADVPVVCADMPSGVQADTGRVEGLAVHGDVTVTFSAPKPGLLLYPGAAYAGEIIVADVGLPADAPVGDAMEVWSREDYRVLMPRLMAEDHKGSRGRLLIVAGSRLYAGAAVLAAGGALRMGAGYVHVAVPCSVVPVIQASLPQVICHPLSETAHGELSAASVAEVVALYDTVDAVALGPGLTVKPSAADAARRMVAACSLPLVLDADGLNAYGVSGLESVTSRPSPTVLTPHPGELGRLLGISAHEIQSDRRAAVRTLNGPSFACLLKGAHTLVAGAGRLSVTVAGNPGMATAGMGDVLCGMIGTLLAQGLSAYESATLGAYLHARSGDLGAEELTPTCLESTDIVRYLPVAVKELADE